MFDPHLESSTAGSTGGLAPDVNEPPLKLKPYIISGRSEMCDYAKQTRFFTSLTPHWQWQLHEDGLFTAVYWWREPPGAELLGICEQHKRQGNALLN